MNREERRKAKKQGKPVPASNKPYHPLANPKLLNMQQIREQATRDAADLAFRLMLSLPCIAMNRYWGFGKKRCGRLVDQCLDLYNEFSSGKLTQEKMLEELERLGGVTITGDDESV